MFTEIRTLKNLMRVAILAVFPLFAACGGGGGDEPSPPADNTEPGTNPIVCIIIFLTSGDTACGDSSSSSTQTSAPQPSTQTAQSTQSSGSVPSLHANQEFEPNGELASANLPLSATRSTPDQKIGWYVAGSINDVTDITDAFAFTPNQTREYNLALCPPEGSTCSGNTGIYTLTAFFRVLDQDGNVLLTSEADTDDGNRHRTTLDAGVLYYVTVAAGDTMGVTVDYRMFVYEIS
jgi:hypothetical protein